MKKLFPNNSEFRIAFRFFIYTLIGAVLLLPLIKKLPMVGWDWYFFFTAHNPDYNLYSARSAYPPFAHYFIEIFSGLNWRSSLYLLIGISLMTIALTTWRQGGKYGSIFLALTTPPVWYLIYIGHPDGLALFGYMTGIIPLALIKPQLTIWGAFTNQKRLFWTVFLLFASLLIWSLWPFRMGKATLTHEAAFGWVVTGWPIAVLGFVLFLGAGNNLFRLISSGLLLSPYLMPYNLAILAPAIGSVQGWRRIALWVSAWFTVLGTGMGGQWRYLNLVFPITTYFVLQTPAGYLKNIGTIIFTFLPSSIKSYYHILVPKELPETALFDHVS